MTEDGSGAPPAPSTTGWKRLLRNPWLWAGLSGLLFVSLARNCTRYVPEPPPVIAPAPSFSLSTLAGASVINKDFAGHPYIAHFVSGECTGDCDVAFAGMKKLQDGFEKGVYGALPVHLVTFVVGDEGVVEHYREWMETEAVDPKRWTFVTGPESILREMVRALATMGDRTADPVWEFGLVLVDSKGRCRGFYGTDRWEIDRVFHQAKDLSREPL